MASIACSIKANQTTNPIRKIVDNLVLPKDHAKPFMNLGLGDPTVHGNLVTPDVLINAVTDALKEHKADGYHPSTGMTVAREAIASSVSTSEHPATAEDVTICSGCSGALEMAIGVLLNPGDNLLVPCPGFPLYQVVAESLSASVRHYNLLPDSDWECDLVHMESLIDPVRTKAILINNPSNPCGSNFSKKHLIAIAALADKYQLPIIADEIYCNVVFHGSFTPMNHVSGNVPVISVGGIAKQYIVPGWRVGWIVLFDKSPTKRLKEVDGGLRRLSTLILGACSLVQAALPRVLSAHDDVNSADHAELAVWENRYHDILKTNAGLCMSECGPGTSCADLIECASHPSGAMYTMMRIHINNLDSSINNDTDFAKHLLTEENLSCLPGLCFGMPNFIRLVICPSADQMRDALDRVKQFAARHRAKVC